MKILLIDTCIRILRKLKVAVVIGVYVDKTEDGDPFIQYQLKTGRTYDCHLNCRTFFPNGEEFVIPHKIPFEITQ